MNWTLAVPEIVLAVCAMAILIFGVLWKSRSVTLACTMLSLGALLLTAVLAVSTPLGGAYHGLFVVDRFAVFMKVLIVAGAALSLVLALDYNVRERIDRFEFPVLILLCTVGMMIMASAANLMSLYIGLELQSLSMYVMAAFARDNVRSSEAGLKFFVLGALASGLLLYGISLAYGFSGTMEFGRLAQSFSGEAFAGGTATTGLVIGVVFIVAGLAFKISAVPFHMWTPDVYEGAPAPVTAFMSTAPKVAAIALLLRALEVPFGHLGGQWQQLVVLISIASMLLGSLAAIGQTNIKRLMAYSSITHVGYMLIGLASVSVAGSSAVMYYLLAYTFTNLAAFIVITVMAKYAPDDEISGYAGLAYRSPPLALALSAGLLSLAGIPPFVGFFAKLYLFLAAIQTGSLGLQVLVIWALIMSAISLYYYGRIIHTMWMRDATETVPVRPAFSQGLALFTSVVGVVAFGILAAPFLAATQLAASTFGIGR